MKMLITAPLSDVLDKYPDVSTLLSTFRLPEDKSSSISASLDLTDVSRRNSLKKFGTRYPCQCAKHIREPV